jgi:two-component system sensor histidine kinase KdpD
MDSSHPDQTEPVAGSRTARSASARTAWVVAACGLVTLLTWPLRDALDPANIAMLYLLAVVFVAMRAGKLAAIVAAFLSTALLDFFFIHPRLSFTVGDAQYAVTLAAMLLVALVVGNLTIVLQRQAAAAIERERQSQALYLLASRLAGASSLMQVAIATRDFLIRAQGCRGMLLMRHDDALHPVEQGLQLNSELQSAAAFAAMRQAQTRHMQEANRYWLFLPLHGSTYVRGVLAIDLGDTAPAEVEARLSLYEAVASLTAIAVERLHFVEVAQRAQLQMTDERLRSSILSALSHDIRTPLTVLYGMADTLALAQLPPALHDAAAAMREQTQRLNGMVSNLLDMAKLRAGNIRLNAEWQPVEEVIGASIKLLGSALAQHPVTVALPPDMPLLKFDAVLMERVLCNLLENAAKYAPPASGIAIRARIENGKALLAVCDNGPGFPEDKLDRLFELFERGDAESNVPGVGLGLAICRGIVEAHGGEIYAHNKNGAHNNNGACVTISLPLGEPPVIRTEDDDE